MWGRGTDSTPRWTINYRLSLGFSTKGNPLGIFIAMTHIGRIWLETGSEKQTSGLRASAAAGNRARVERGGPPPPYHLPITYPSFCPLGLRGQGEQRRIAELAEKCPTTHSIGRLSPTR